MIRILLSFSKCSSSISRIKLYQYLPVDTSIFAAELNREFPHELPRSVPLLIGQCLVPLRLRTMIWHPCLSSIANNSCYSLLFCYHKSALVVFIAVCCLEEFIWNRCIRTISPTLSLHRIITVYLPWKPLQDKSNHPNPESLKFEAFFPYYNLKKQPYYMSLNHLWHSGWQQVIFM